MLFGKILGRWLALAAGHSHTKSFQSGRFCTVGYIPGCENFTNTVGIFWDSLLFILIMQKKAVLRKSLGDGDFTNCSTSYTLVS